MAERFTNPVPQMLDTNGDPVAGGKLNFFENTTTTPQDTFSDTALSVANANPVILDGDGRAPNIFMQEALYTVRLDDADDVEIWTRDNVASIADLNDTALTYAALKAIDVTSLTEGQDIYVENRATAGDGGAGHFYATQVNPGADNDGTILHSDTAGWYFVRQGIEQFNVKWWGAAGDNSTDDTTAIQTAINYVTTIGGFIYFPAGVYKCINLVLKTGVYLVGDQGPLTNPASAHSTTLSSNGAGVIVDTDGTAVFNVGVIGLTIGGAGAGTAVKGIHFDLVKRGIIQNCTFNNLSEQAILLDSDSGVCVIVDNFAQNCLLDRTQAAKIGVLDIDGTDHWIVRGEYGASQTALSDANAYLCAVVVRGGNHMLDTVVGEISDCGIHITGVTSNSRFVSCRADLNFGNDWEIEGSADLVECLALRGGRETDNTYDGFLITAGNGTYTGCQAKSLGADAWAHRYGFNDTQTSDANKNFYDSGCRSFTHGTAAFNLTATGGAHVTPTGAAKTFTDQDATPSVENYGTFTVNNTVATSITDFIDPFEGQVIEIRATNALTTFVHNAAILVTVTGQDRVTIANRIYIFKSLNGIWYEKSPRHGWIKHATEHLAVSSGTEIDWTGIPADVVEIKIVYNAHSADAADELSVRLGDSGGFHVTAGDYSGRVRNATAGTDWDTEAPISNAAAAAHITSGTIYITHITGATWGMNGTATTETVELHVAGGYMDALDSVLSQLRLFMDGGAAFDGGGNYVLYHRD